MRTPEKHPGPEKIKLTRADFVSMALVRANRDTLAILAGALLIRMLVIAYGDWHDQTFLVPFTDIDYFVFDGASEMVYNGGSPYERATYRYTPLVAYLLLVNQWTGFSWAGKLIFSLFDVLCGFLLLSFSSKEYVCTLWLYNPFVIAISSRGSAESIICTLVISFLFFLKKDLRNISALFFGLAVHFKMYPIIYTWPLFLFYLSRKGSASRNILEFVKYGCVSGGVFLALGGFFYLLYGYQFLHESFLYHITRKDHRHNMSLYFLYFYLEIGGSHAKSASPVVHLLSFLPQIVLIFSAGFGFFWTKRPFSSLVFSCFLISMIFVTFNKVCTSQYFLWYLCFLPIVVSSLVEDVGAGRMVQLLPGCFFWVVSQIVWLWFAYLLEFRGSNTYWEIFLSSGFFFVANCYTIYSFVGLYQESERLAELKGSEFNKSA